MTIAATATIEHEDPALVSAFYGLARANPLRRFLVTSGDRIHQPSSGPFPIAPEGRSLHQRWAVGLGPDEAIDVWENGSPIASLGSAELALYGLQTPVGNDPVHLTLTGWNG